MAECGGALRMREDRAFADFRGPPSAPNGDGMGGGGGLPGGGLAYKPQGETLLPRRTVLGNILAAREADGSHARASRKEALALLEAFDLAPFAQSFPHELSGGMRQRIAFLRAVFARRDLLLLDEPPGALDPLTRMEIQDWLGQIRHGLGKTVVLVTHDAEEAVLLADRVVVLTPRPARVAAEFSVGWAQPRLRSSPEVQTVRQAILDVLASTTSHGKEARAFSPGGGGLAPRPVGEAGTSPPAPRLRSSPT